MHASVLIVLLILCQVSTGNICARLFYNGDFTDDGLDIASGGHIQDLNDTNWSWINHYKAASAIMVMKHCQLIGYKEKHYQGEVLVHIGPVCLVQVQTAVLGEHAKKCN